jgi:hypothetical protein
MANWPQFQRIRYEVGLIRDIHEAVVGEYAVEMEIRELPFTICAGDTTVLFENLWVGLPE